MKDHFLTQNNHFKFGFKEDFDDRTCQEDNFYISLTRCTRMPYDWRTECIMAAKQIATRANQPIRVLMSGGIDSEVVALSFLFARITFKVSIVRFKNDWNLHDIIWAVKFCESHGIVYNFIDLDIEEFYHSREIIDLSKMMGISAAMNLLQCKAAIEVSKSGEFPISGNGDVLIRYYRSSWYVYYAEHFARLALLTQKINSNGVIWFFQYTPEMVLSWLLDSEVQNFVKQNMLTTKSLSDSSLVHRGYYPKEDAAITQNYRAVKIKAIQNHFNIEDRPKFRGFEKFKDLEELVSIQLDKNLIGATQHLFFSYQTIIDQLKPL